MVLASVVTVIALSVRYAGEGSEENNYTPGDTRLHTISTFFCASVQIKMTADTSQLGYVNLYLLNQKPALTARDSFSIPNPFTLDQYGYNYWHFYLYPNSNFSVNACVNSGSSSYYFYVIKGSDDFNQWKDHASPSYSESYKYISTVCGSGNMTLSYTAKQEDHYYFAYYCDAYSCTGSQEIFLQRFEYTVGNMTDFDNCTTTVSNEQCSLNVPYQSDYDQALITTVEEPPNGDWELQFTIEFNCGARVEAYLAVVLPPVVLFLIVLAGIFLGCYLHIKLKKHAYNPLPEPTTLTSSSANPPAEPEKLPYIGATQPLAEPEKPLYMGATQPLPPPPYNPQQQPPPYQ